MTAKSFVYFVATNDRSKIKIGCSAVPPHRLAHLAAWSPLPLDILAAVEGVYEDERALHTRYLAQHSHKEWFHSSPQMLADIAAIAHLNELPLSFRGKKGQPNSLPRDNTVRNSPEWRAKVSVIHKERWARERRHRAIIRAIEESGMDIAALNKQMGEQCINRRQDGSLYVWSDDDIYAALEVLLRKLGYPTSEAA